MKNFLPISFVLPPQFLRLIQAKNFPSPYSDFVALQFYKTIQRISRLCHRLAIPVPTVHTQLFMGAVVSICIPSPP